MGKKPNWTQEEIDYLQDKWGSISIQTISGHLGRSIYSIKIKVNKLGLPGFLESGDYVSFNQLYSTVTGNKAVNSYQTKSWIENRGFPVRYKRVNKSKFRVVYLNDFWEWAEKNQSFLDFSKFEKHSLGAEPEWVDKKRKQDIEKANKFKSTPWTEEENLMLTSLLKTYKYTWTELSEKMHRTIGGISKQIYILGLKERPLREPPHSKWTDEQLDILKESIFSGDNYTTMADKIGKSEKAIRGKVYVLYGTEVLDKIREREVAKSE